MVKIDYKNGLEKDQIDKVIIDLDIEKAIELSVINIYDENDNELLIGRNLRLSIKDNNYGEEELYVDLNLENGKDILKVIHKMLRQIDSKI